jgi:hypothetical protein
MAFFAFVKRPPYFRQHFIGIPDRLTASHCLVEHPETFEKEGLETGLQLCSASARRSLPTRPKDGT